MTLCHKTETGEWVPNIAKTTNANADYEHSEAMWLEDRRHARAMSHLTDRLAMAEEMFEHDRIIRTINTQKETP